MCNTKIMTWNSKEHTLEIDFMKLSPTTNAQPEAEMILRCEKVFNLVFTSTISITPLYRAELWKLLCKQCFISIFFSNFFFLSFLFQRLHKDTNNVGPGRRRWGKQWSAIKSHESLSSFNDIFWMNIFFFSVPRCARKCRRVSFTIGENWSLWASGYSGINVNNDLLFPGRSRWTWTRPSLRQSARVIASSTTTSFKLKKYWSRGPRAACTIRWEAACSNF